MPPRSAIVVPCLLLSALGCATWQKPESNFRLPVPQLPADAIICQVAFLRWEAHLTEQDQEFWRSADEQFQTSEMRKRLSENGLRAGLVSGQLPTAIQQQLEATHDPFATLSVERPTPGVEMLSRREKRQFRLGIGEVVEVLPHRSQSAIVLLSEGGDVRAEKFDQPRGFFLMTVYAQPDGRLRLEMLPGIEHGDPKQRVMGGQGILRMDTRRDQHLYRSLTFEAPMTPDQTLIVTSTHDSKGVGGTFFANRFESSTEQLFLLIRLARAQRDDLFAPAEKPLVTPFD